MSDALTSADPDTSPDHRVRRDYFVIFTTAGCLIGSATLAQWGAPDSTTVRAAVDGMLSIANDLALLFVGASALDHTGLLNAVGRRFMNGKGNS